MGRLPRCVILETRIRVKSSPEGTEVTGGMHNLGVVFLCNGVNKDLPRQFNLYTRNGRNNSTMMVMIFVSKKRGDIRVEELGLYYLICTGSTRPRTQNFTPRPQHARSELSGKPHNNKHKPVACSRGKASAWYIRLTAKPYNSKQRQR